LRFVLEDVKGKFDLVIEAVHMTNERLGRHEKAEEERFSRLETEVLQMKGDILEMKGDIVEMKGDIVQTKDDIRGLRQDFNDHRLNTELHAGKKGKKVS
jgi:predicted  nucleic acid-binding Zn-ribbon protein